MLSPSDINASYRRHFRPFVRMLYVAKFRRISLKCCIAVVQGGSNMTGTDLYVNKPHCAAGVRP